MAFEGSEMVETITVEGSAAQEHDLIPPQTVASVSSIHTQAAVPAPSSCGIETTDPFYETYEVLWSTFERLAAKWGTASVLVIWPAEWQEFASESELISNFAFTGDPGLVKILAYQDGILAESFETAAPPLAI